MVDPKELLRRAGAADAHADSLMWNRDLNRASGSGHVDFPRLREAGVSLQCFTVVTRGFPFIGGFPAFALSRGWPTQALWGEWARCQWQLDRLDAFCAASGGQAAKADSRAALEANLAQGRLSAVVGVEGAHALEGRVDRVEALWRRGVRFMSLTHLSNNALGGSSFPLMRPRGLTAHGREVLEEMGRLGMSVDLAHASRRTLEDIFEVSGPRLMCSHTGVRAEGGGWRNLTDEDLRRISERGGVVGIIFATVYLGGKSPDDVVRHIRHALDVMGEDAVALGSDFDGMIPLPRGMRDVRDLHLLVEAMDRSGMAQRQIEKVLGGNWRRYFAETLDGAPHRRT
jgi:membrane dipeptidase